MRQYQRILLTLGEKWDRTFRDETGHTELFIDPTRTELTSIDRANLVHNSILRAYGKHQYNYRGILTKQHLWVWNRDAGQHLEALHELGIWRTPHYTLDVVYLPDTDTLVLYVAEFSQRDTEQTAMTGARLALTIPQYPVLSSYAEVVILNDLGHVIATQKHNPQ